MPSHRPVKIAPSILAADFSAFGAECRAVMDQGADWVHVDVMDGHFVPNLSFGPAMCAALRPHIRGVMDVHLMIAPVDPWIDAFARTGADMLTVHLESGPHVHRTLQAIRAAGCKAGLAINPGTGLDALPWLLDLCDLVCVMTVNPGFGGQSLIDGQLAKISALRDLIGDSPIEIEVDGGVTVANAGAVAAAGATVLVAGVGIFKGGSAANPAPYGAAIRAIRAAAAAG